MSMEYLFTVNPLLRKGDVVIYGRGRESKRIFRELLQQGVRVSAFCLREHEEGRMNRLFGRLVITFGELPKRFPNAWVIIPGCIAREYESLRKIGVENLMIENVTMDDVGILVEEDGGI